MKLACKILGHKLGWEIFDPRPCLRIGCDHVEPARERPPCPPMPKIIIKEFEPTTGELVIDPRWKGEPVKVFDVPKAITNMKFTDKPTLSQWAALGVQCGKTAYMAEWIKWFIYENVREHPYRHMWE